MRKVTHASFIPAVVASLCALIATSTLRAQSSDLASRLPQNVNAVMTIDVNKLLQSPMGKEQALQSKLLSGYADRPLAIPATARNVVIGAAVDPTDLQSYVQVALIDLSNPPRLDPMLRAQGGYLDQIAGKNVGWSKRGIMYIEMDNHTLGVARPGARQFVARWLGGKTQTGLSQPLTAALASAKDADAVLAVDLDGAVGIPALNFALAMGQFPSLEKLEGSQPGLIKALASVTDMQIKMHFTDKIEAQWVINFGQSVGALGGDVKPFIVDVLKAAEWYEPGLENNWDFKAEGKTITGNGTMELARFTRLVALLGPGDIGQPAAQANGQAPGQAPGDAKPAPESTQNPAAVASQKYFRAIAKSLDNISVKASPTASAGWLMAQARQFEQLPVLNVDPDLLSWGQMVTQGYMRAGQELALGQQQAKMAAGRIESPTGYTTEAPNGGGVETADTRAAYQNAQQQRRSAAMAEKNAAAQRALDILNQLVDTRSKVRADMTQRYGIEF